MDILELAREVGAATPANLYGRTDYIVMTFYELERFAALFAAAERKACAELCSEVAAGKDAEAIEEAIPARELNSFEDDRKKADKQNKLFDDLKKLRDESHTIVGASDDYKQGREMGIQLCINKLGRGEK